MNAVSSVLVAVDPAAAFELFTEDVDAWWQRGPAYRLGGRLVELLDPATGEEWELGRIRVWQPGQRLVFEYRIPNFAPDQSTELEVRFEPRRTGTYVTVEHRGRAGLPKGYPACHGLGDVEVAEQRGDWWLKQPRSLRSHAGVAR